MDLSRCPSCNAARDPDDNFCRRCGRQITVNLPAVKEANLPAETTGGLPPSLVGSVAVLAAGTALEWLARRLAGNAARAAGRALVRREPTPVAKTRHAQTATPAVTVREFFYVREVDVNR